MTIKKVCSFVALGKKRKKIKFLLLILLKVYYNAT